MKVRSLGIGWALLLLAALAIRSPTFPVTDPNTRVATFDVAAAIPKTHGWQQAVAAPQAKFRPRRAGETAGRNPRSAEQAFRKAPPP